MILTGIFLQVTKYFIIYGWNHLVYCSCRMNWMWDNSQTVLRTERKSYMEWAQNGLKAYGSGLG